MTAGSGPPSRAPFATYDPNSSSWRTSRPSGRADSGKSSPTWPRSGMTRGGHAFELPTWVPRTGGTAGSASPTLPTPAARDWKSGASNLLPLLKTPTANLGMNGSAQHPDKRRGGGHGPTLDDEVAFLLPDTDGVGWHGRAGDEPEADRWGEPSDRCHSPADWWGGYLPAIRRWEHMTGTAAPSPTEIGPRGGRRLAASFAEWLMGWPAGWVTDVPGLTRAQQLHKTGNGVVPAQAFAAFERLVGPLESVADNPDNKPPF